MPRGRFCLEAEACASCDAAPRTRYKNNGSVCNSKITINIFLPFLYCCNASVHYQCIILVVSETRLAISLPSPRLLGSQFEQSISCCFIHFNHGSM